MVFAVKKEKRGNPSKCQRGDEKIRINDVFLCLLEGVEAGREGGKERKKKIDRRPGALSLNF